MDEGTALAVGRELAGGGIFETFDDGLPGARTCQLRPGPRPNKTRTHCLPRTVVTDDQGQRTVKGDGLLVLRPEGAYAEDG